MRKDRLFTGKEAVGKVLKKIVPQHIEEILAYRELLDSIIPSAHAEEIIKTKIQDSYLIFYTKNPIVLNECQLNHVKIFKQMKELSPTPLPFKGLKFSLPDSNY